jgi:hypothetical protein
MGELTGHRGSSAGALIGLQFGVLDIIADMLRAAGDPNIPKVLQESLPPNCRRCAKIDIMISSGAE